MQYSEGRLGRVFVLKMDDGEDLIESLQKFLREKEIGSCMALFIGALREGRAVTGPEQPVIPPVPHFVNFDDGWETFGMATVYPSADGLKLHIHSALGRGEEALTGCIREKANVYLTVEMVIFEFSGLKAARTWDEKAELFLLSLEKKL
ncbi:MAG: DNA-binding protein [Methanothrix sp.]|nr:MAG: DNA-binding protein [Methanothrix sp.]